MPPNGAFIRLTAYSWDDHGQDIVTIDPAVWLLVDDDSLYRELYVRSLILGDRTGLTKIDNIGVDETRRDMLIGTHDQYEIVPDDQVPDEVWAKLALLRLTGDAS